MQATVGFPVITECSAQWTGRTNPCITPEIAQAVLQAVRKTRWASTPTPPGRTSAPAHASVIAARKEQFEDGEQAGRNNDAHSQRSANGEKRTWNEIQRLLHTARSSASAPQAVADPASGKLETTLAGILSAQVRTLVRPSAPSASC